MINRPVFLSLWRWVSFPLLLAAQDKKKYEDQLLTLPDRSVKANWSFVGHWGTKENSFKTEWYQLSGLQSSQLLIEMPWTMTCTYVGKPEPSVLSAITDTVPEWRIINVFPVKSPNHPISLPNKLAPSIQIKF